MTSEAVVQTNARLEAARAMAIVMRNNVGVAVDDQGRHIRYGLMNSSPQENAAFKSSDLICCTPTLITPQHVGYTVGVFTALECKHSGWHLTPGDKRGQAQLRFLELIRGVGGFAGFVTGPGDVSRIIGRG